MLEQFIYQDQIFYAKGDALIVKMNITATTAQERYQVRIKNSKLQTGMEMNSDKLKQTLMGSTVREGEKFTRVVE